MNVRLLTRAARDLNDIRTYISRDDPATAHRIAERLGASIRLIAQRPEIGRATGSGDIRLWTVAGLPYLIAYRVKRDRLEVLRVMHTKRKRPVQW